MKKLGLIINPIAGIGGRVGLKGSDGIDIRNKAFALGAVPESHGRAVQALKKLKSTDTKIVLITYPAEMGEDAAKECGYNSTVIGSIEPGRTIPEDTRQAAREMLSMCVDLILFAGGDGTARDIFIAIGEKLPVVGIPAGVKVHSAVYARDPTSAGEMAASYLQGQTKLLREVEVMDIDEDAYRRGNISTRLYGYLKVPYRRSLLGGLKSPSTTNETASQTAIAHEIVDKMEKDVLYIIGPGSTTRAITSLLGLDKTLLGVDVLLNRQVLTADVNEQQLLDIIEGHQAKIVITPIGGQGFLFGRGNQQISPKIIRHVGLLNIIVVSTSEKINSLSGRPFLVDTGDNELDMMMADYTRVITGYNEGVVYKVSG